MNYEKILTATIWFLAVIIACHKEAARAGVIVFRMFSPLTQSFHYKEARVKLHFTLSAWPSNFRTFQM